MFPFKLYDEDNVPKIIQLLVQYSGGIITSEKQAAQILMGLAIALMALSLFFIFHTPASEKPIHSIYDSQGRFE